MNPSQPQPEFEQQIAQRLVQRAQSEIGQLQMTYRDTQPQFWALGVAWQALRFAWYVVAGDHDAARAKLSLVEDAIADYEHWTALRRAGVPDEGASH